MAASKKDRQIKYGGNPSREIRTGANPNSIYSCTPSWNFHLCDKSGAWAFTQERLNDVFWKKVLPFLSSLESMTWNEILIGAKKEHHTISIEKLNSCAQKRLNELNQYPDSLVSLRLGGTIRIYGILEVSTLCILWYDDNHGNNNDCVCRSFEKHT